jgi:2',3'-cyclic-nucleotide 2'-phosphodiesterase (5'-nucleotidase family)
MKSKIASFLVLLIASFSLNGQNLLTPSVTHTSSLSPADRFDESASEIPAFDPITKRVFISNDANTSLEVLELSKDTNGNPALAYLFNIDLSTIGGGVNAVSVSNGLVAIAVQNSDKQANGKVAIFSTNVTANGSPLATPTVGALPDHLTFSNDGSKIVVANEGEPNDDYDNDPHGSISIINLSGSAGTGISTNVTTLDFTSYNSKKQMLIGKGVRIFGNDGNVTVAQDLEPEYVAITEDDTKAFVTLQENNAFAVVDLVNLEITEILPLGYKDWGRLGLSFDASNKDDSINGGYNPFPWRVLGMYQPDSVVSYNVNGKNYFVTANEGDSRDYTGYSEEVRVKDLNLSYNNTTQFPSISLTDMAKLEGLKKAHISNVDPSASFLSDIRELKSIGEVTALIPEASTAEGNASLLMNGQSGDTQFPFLSNMKALATVGEFDPKTGYTLTGYPDGQAAWLEDNSTIRVAYQSESYATMGKETYPWEMSSGVSFTGSHIHTIDYDRSAFADFLKNNDPASSMFKSSGKLFHTIYNVFGNKVVPKDKGGLWGNQTDENGTMIEFADSMQLSEADFFFQSFCGAWYEKKNRYGSNKGFADDVWLTAEEWSIRYMFPNYSQSVADSTMGLASIVVDIANETAYTVPALGQTGYEKLMPINPGHTDYVVLVLAGYNHGQEPAPNKIYVGIKGKDANGTAIPATANARDQFLSRNGLLYGKIYGLAVANADYNSTLGIATPDPTAKMMDDYLKDANASDKFSGKFYPTSFRWDGFDTPEAVKDTEMMLWEKTSEQPTGYTFFNGDTKTEHPAVDPDITKHRFVQNMTDEGGLLGFDLGDLTSQLTAANGALPTSLDVNVTRLIAAIDGNMTLNVGGKGVGNGTTETAAKHIEKNATKMVAPDGLFWAKTADADILIVDEDSGNDYGERKYALILNPTTFEVNSTGYFLAQAGGDKNVRASYGLSAYGNTFDYATTSEFSGSWNVSALVAKKGNGSFYSPSELTGTQEEAINQALDHNNSKFIGVIQHRSESGGPVANFRNDRGGQILMFGLDLPIGGRTTSGSSQHKALTFLEANSSAYTNPNKDIQDSDNLGRLKTTKANGDADGDGLYETIYAYGGRSFSIWDEDGKLIFDSGNDLEKIAREYLPNNYHASNDVNDGDNRSDDKGTEPEGLTIGKIGDTIYAFVGLERVGGIVAYDVTNPDAPIFLDYVNNRNFAYAPYEDDDDEEDLNATALPLAKDLGPEGMVFVDSIDSPTGNPLLIVSNEVSGTTTVYTVGVSVPLMPVENLVVQSSGESIHLNWVDNNKNSSGSKVFRSSNGGTPTLVATLDPGITDWIDETVDTSSEYSYHIEVFNAEHSAKSSVSAPLKPSKSIISVIDSFRQSSDVADPEGYAEISAFDPLTNRIFVSNGEKKRVDVFNFSREGKISFSHSLSLPSGFGGINSVAVSNGMLAVAAEADVKQDKGSALLYSTDAKAGDAPFATIEVGSLPDHLIFTPDGLMLLVANEGEPNDAYTVDPHGSISIINVKDASLLKSNPSANVTLTAKTLDFTKYNSRKAEFQESGIRIFGNDGKATVAQDLEPEYIAVSPDGKQAVVTLQENNAVAIVDLEILEIVDVAPLGFKDWAALGLTMDATDKDEAYNPFLWPVLGMYQPDAIASFAVGGKTYYITANEGDAREYDGYSEEVRVDDLTLEFGLSSVYDGLSKAHISNVDSSYSFEDDLNLLSPIGSTSALIAEASTAGTNEDFLVDGMSGDSDFPFAKFKPLATVGEYDPVTGYTLTGYPDGQAAWLADDSTIRVAYQSESYATMSSETYPWEMSSNATFTGSHIHTIDYDREKFATFLHNGKPASSMFKASGHLFSKVYNVFGNEVVAKKDGGLWGNQTDENGTIIEFADSMKLSQADFFFQSFCGAWYEQANKYGTGIGLANDVWFTAEEWAISYMFPNYSQSVADSTMGLASIVVDIENQTAYTAPALGQTGYEKIMPINPGHSDYVVMVLAGYNHGQEPAPNKIYVGMKGKAADGTAIASTANSRDKFLADNGLLYGKIYGLAVATGDYAALGISTIDPTDKMMDAYLKDADAADTFSGKFFPTSFRWDGFDSPEAVKNTEMKLWEKTSEQPSGHTFFNGDTKTEHPAVDPDITKHRFIQNMTDEGGLLGFDLGDLTAQLTAASGDLPASLDVSVTRIVAAVDGALELDTGGKGVGHGSDKTASEHIEKGQSKMVAPDGLYWVKTKDANVLIVDEDSGNDYGERKYAIVIDPSDMTLSEDNKGYFLAMAGGSKSPRAAAGVSALGDAYSSSTSAEFSGSWNVSALIDRKADGSFYSASELSGTQIETINQSKTLAQSSFIGVVQMRGESGGAVKAFRNDNGGQIFMFNMSLPGSATSAISGLTAAHVSKIDSGKAGVFAKDVASARTIGETTSLIAEAGTALHDDQIVDGGSGDTDFPYLSGIKPLATVGEYDAVTGRVLTGYPDGQAAWLADEDTIRVAYQSESYATMGAYGETYPMVMENGVSFTGSHIHTIDYHRAKFAEFLNNSTPASDMIEGSGILFDTVYNIFGDVVTKKSAGGLWGNQTGPDKKIKEFASDYKLSEADFFFQSFCGSWYEPANKYGNGIGLANDVWLTAEEWAIGRMFENGTSNDTMGLASIVVDIANETAYTAPALGQTGYEKIMPINPGHSDYVVLVMAGYNHNQEPAPNRIYVGIKGKAANGSNISSSANARDKFLAANGLLYGKLYGLAVKDSDYAALGISTIDPTEKMMDGYMKDADAANTFSGKFFPTSFQWDGFDTPEAVEDTEMMLWEKSSEQPSGYTFFNGDTKTEHPAVDPDISKHRFVQNMTDEGGLLGFDLGNLTSQLTAANGALPSSLDVTVTRIVAAVDGALVLKTNGKGIGHNNTSDASEHIEKGQSKMVAPDGLYWMKGSDGDVLIVDEDSGNDYGERKYALPINSSDMTLAEAKTGYFLAQAAGKYSPRGLAGVSAYRGANSQATSAEFSGSWNVSALIAKKSNGSFYTQSELSGTGEQVVNGAIKIADSTLIGVVQSRSDSGGPVAAFRADAGGQVFMFSMDLSGNVSHDSRLESELNTPIFAEYSDDYPAPHKSLQDKLNLGRLKTTTANGDIDGDGKHEFIFSYGGRSFSIWDENGEQVYDSGNMIEHIVRNHLSDYGSSYTEKRSDDKGSEPEGVTIGVVDGKTYAFVGLERSDAILVFDVTDPKAPVFLQFATNPGDVSPEGLAFIPAGDSPTGHPVLIVTNEVSGSITAWGMSNLPVGPVKGLSIHQDADVAILRWDDSSSIENGYIIYRQEGIGSPFVELGRVKRNITSFYDTDIQPGQFYTYKIHAFNDVSESRMSQVKSSQADIRLTILHANDAEQLMPTALDSGNYGGAALFISKMKDLRSEFNSKGHGVLSISAGDNLMPGRELSASLGGDTLYHSMFLDQAGFEFVSIGNHEFDAGPDVTASFINSAKYPTFLSSNLNFSAHKPLNDLFISNKIVKSTLVDVTIADKIIKVGLVGATTKNLNFISSPSPVVVDLNVVGSVQAEVDSLTTNGASLVILVSHLQGVSEELSLLTQLSGVDVVIAGGGDNRLANPSDKLIPGESAEGSYPLIGLDKDGSAVPVVTVDGQLKYIGRLTLNLTSSGEVTGWNGGPQRVVDSGIDQFHGTSPDIIAYETIENPIEKYVSSLSALKISNEISFALDGGKDDIRARETNLGNLIADSQLWVAQTYAKDKNAPVADVALANGGGIRASINESGSSNYKASVDDTYTVLPFGNIVTVVPNVSAAELKLLLENAYSKTVLSDGKPKRSGDGTGRFAQVAGFTVEYDITAKPMVMDENSVVTQQGVRVVNAAMNDGKKIIENGIPADNLTLNVAIVDFLADNKGDQYFTFRSGAIDNIKLGFTYQAALAEYISAGLKGDLSKYEKPDGRIKFDAKASSDGVQASSVSGFFPGAKKLEGGWKELSWFGSFWDQEFPWIYHAEHGWLYAGGTGGASMWFYDLQTGWWWTNEQHYPYVYLDSVKDWIFYQKNAQSKNRFFYLFSDGGNWVTYPKSGQ